jgi:hypothetical protein
MASGVTDAGKTILLNNSFKGSTVAADYHLILISDVSGVDRDLTTLAGVTELPTGAGYTAGGKSIAYSAITVTDVGGTPGAKAVIDDQQWDATGTFPASGTGARYAVLADGTTSSDNIIAWFDLTEARTLTSGQFLKLSGCEVDLNAPA